MHPIAERHKPTPQIPPENARIVKQRNDAIPSVAGVVTARAQQQREADEKAYPDLVQRAAAGEAGALDELVATAERLGVVAELVDADITAARAVLQAEAAAVGARAELDRLEAEHARLFADNKRLRAALKANVEAMAQHNTNVAVQSSKLDAVKRAKAMRSARLTKNEFPRV